MQNDTKSSKSSTNFFSVLKIQYIFFQNNAQTLHFQKVFTGMVFRLGLLSNPIYNGSKVFEMLRNDDDDEPLFKCHKILVHHNTN